MRKIILSGALALSACATGQPQQTTAVLEAGLTVAERTALAYVSLPRCPQGAPVCSSPAVVQKIRDADNGAYGEIKSVEAAVAAGGSPDTSVAAAALTTFQNVLSTPAVAAALKGVK